MSLQGVRDTLGAVLIGSGIAAILTGVVTTQTVFYFQHYPEDKAPAKVMVAVVWFLDILHISMILTSDWLWLIDHFGDTEIAGWIPWSLGLTVLLTAMVTVIVHAFFAYRIFGLSKGNWFVVGPIVVLAGSRLGLAVTTCAKMLIYKNFAEFKQHASWVFTMGLVTSSVLDIVTTSCLVWYLDRARTGFAGMDQIINTLSLYAIESGLLTCLAVVISLGFWLGMRGNLVFMAIHFVVAKLYANSLLAALNSRKHIRDRSRGASYSEGPQPVTVFNLRRGTVKKHSTDRTSSVRISVEKSAITHDGTDIGLSPIRSQEEREEDSLEAATTSKTNTFV